MKPSVFSNVCKHTRIKIIGILFLMLALPMLSNAQSTNPVKWTFEATKLNNEVYELHLIARIDEGWRIYSQFPKSGTNLPTLIKFNNNPQITVQGSIQEAGKIKKGVTKMDLGRNYFVEMVNFKQIVRLKTGTSPATITGSIRYTPVSTKEIMSPRMETFSIVIGK